MDYSVGGKNIVGFILLKTITQRKWIGRNICTCRERPLRTHNIRFWASQLGRETMTDERSVTINLPLVQSSGSLNSATNGNGVNQQTPQTPTTNSGAASSITIQTALPGSNSFSVGTKANQSIISDAPITDPGGNTTKQVKLSQTICIQLGKNSQLNEKKQIIGKNEKKPLVCTCWFISNT